MSKKLFITGTGTDVGKTYVTGLILKKLWESGKNAAYYKAAMSGNVRDPDGRLIPGDALQVKTMSGIEQPLDSMCPYVYEAAVSPHLASRMEGNPVQLSLVRDTFQQVCGEYDYVTMEGSGGILCPLRFDEEKLLLDDLVKELNLSSLIVADAGLGTINSVVLTAKYMQAKGLAVKGIVFNNFHSGNVMEEDNRFMCEAMTGLKVLSCVCSGDTELAMDADAIAQLYE